MLSSCRDSDACLPRLVDMLSGNGEAERLAKKAVRQDGERDARGRMGVSLQPQASGAFFFPRRISVTFLLTDVR